MDKPNTSRHISGKFNEELEAVRNQVLTMGGLVEQQLRDSLYAIEKADHQLAEQILQRDKRVNALEVQIDEACVQIIAKRQPAASDLRLIIAIFKTISDLERIGDEVERIAKVALESFSKDRHEFLLSLENLGHLVLSMLHGVLDAFARMDLDAAYEVHQMDAQADRQYEALTRQLMTYMMEDPRAIPKVMNVVWSARSLERIGDRCKNVAEYIIFFVKGKDVRHVSAESMAQTVKGGRD